MTSISAAGISTLRVRKGALSGSVKLFMLVVAAHWAEHLTQAFQIYALGWSPKQAGGVLGLWFPWLISSEVMHYGYAVVMLVCIGLLRGQFGGLSRQVWMLGFALQFWHHFEHLLLFAQALVGRNLADAAVPMSLLQFFVPRVELHLFYNTLVTIPLVIAMIVVVRRSRAESR